MSCKHKFLSTQTPQQLNTRLIPVFLQGMNDTEQTAFLEASTKVAILFRNQAIKFIGQLKNAKRQLAEKRMVCPIRIPWEVSNPPLLLGQQLQSSYLDFFLGSRTGFALILSKIISYYRKKKTCFAFKQNGKAIC